MRVVDWLLPFRSLRHARSRRQRSQGLLEYGLITACLAFAGVAGFGALADAQKSYLTTYPKNVPAPTVKPNQLYHPTTFVHKLLPALDGGFTCDTTPPDTQSVTWSASAAAGPPLVPIECWDAEVADTFNSPIPPDVLNPPQGTQDWTFEERTPGGALVATSTQTCTVPPAGSGISNRCTYGFPRITFPVTAADVNNTVTVIVRFIPISGFVWPDAYHFAATSRTKSILITP